MPDVIESIDAAGGASTTYTLAIGQTAQGSISTLGDHDWFRVDLVAGQTYTFALVGTGSSGVRDPLLSLRGPDGTTIVASNDDGLPNNNSVFTYTATVTGTYYIDVGAFNNGGAGQYGVSVAAGSRATVDAQMGAGIIDAYTASGDFEFSWSATPGTGATVTVGFRMTNDGLEPNFSQFTPQQMAAVLAILQYYSDVCGLTFNVVNPGGYTDNATILLSNYSEDDSSGGYAQYPGSTAANDQAGNIHINAFENSTTSLPLGSYEFFTLMHEIGHAVGLSHPGLYNAGSGQVITYATHAQFTQDTHQYTVMGYFDESNTTTSFGSYPDTLMLYDIYALQQIYGANTATRSGNTVYGFNSTAGGVYDFTINTDPALCIWDGGGIDTLDCSGYSNSQIISLVAGTFSNIGGFSGNVSIAIGAVIENAVGGSGADTITGNDANNVLDGKGGNDTINGGAGIDTVDYSWTTTGVSVNLSAASNQAVGSQSGTDQISNVENVNGGSGADTLIGNSANNVLDGRGGDDYMVGGAGNDIYFVGSIGDEVTENAGEGIDTVYTNSNYIIGANVEQLYLMESAGAATGVGNGEQNLLVGNSFDNVLDGGANNDQLEGGGGNDTLQGGAGNDGMIGGTGNDTYFVDSVFDVIIENAGEGIDTVYTNSNYIIGANVEQLYLMESAGAAAGVGNGEQNLLVGNSFDNVLDGGANNDQLEGGGGSDTLQGGAGNDGMIGGTGNDTYFVDSVFDVIIENAGEGIDTVYTNSNYIIGANVEQLYLMESAGAATGVGNGEQNLLVGNSFDNALDGGANNDTLQGGGGNDTLFGGTGIDGLQGDAGNDNFVFNPGTAAGDAIVDFNGNGAGAGDHLSFVGFGAGATFTQLDATHWVLTYNGGADTEVITFQNAATIHASDFLFL